MKFKMRPETYMKLRLAGDLIDLILWLAAWALLLLTWMRMEDGQYLEAWACLRLTILNLLILWRPRIVPLPKTESA